MSKTFFSVLLSLINNLISLALKQRSLSLSKTKESLTLIKFEVSTNHTNPDLSKAIVLAKPQFILRKLIEFVVTLSGNSGSKWAVDSELIIVRST